MKHLKYIAISFLIIALATFASCKKEFLDKAPHDAVPFEEAIQSEADLEAAVNGIYNAMRGSALYGRTLPIMGDILADNVYIFEVNSNRYIPFTTYAIFDDNGDVDGVWVTAYNAILKANLAINAEVPASETVDQLRGEALTLRACIYFNLVQVFAKSYFPENLSSLAVPLVLTFDQESKPARNTVSEIYEQILTDLHAAIDLLTEEKDSEYITTWAAKGLLAKVYQYMGDWVNAKTYADDVIINSGYTLVDSADFVAYWADPAASENSETLFELSLDAVENNGTDGLSNFYADAGYGDAMCDSNFYNFYSDVDVRKQLMYEGMRSGQPVVWVNKYQNTSNATDKDDIKILRLAEVYLILSEANYNLGDEANAKLYLNTIAQIREPSFTGYTSSGETLLNDITNERRKELAFEGNRFFDMNRLGLGIERGLQFPSDALTIPADDYRRIMPIPLREMNANSNMTQNPGY